MMKKEDLVYNYTNMYELQRGIPNAAVIELAAPFSAANSIQCFQTAKSILKYFIDCYYND